MLRAKAMQARWIWALRTSVRIGSSASSGGSTGISARAVVGSRSIPSPSFIQSVSLPSWCQGVSWNLSGSSALTIQSSIGHRFEK